MRNRSTRTRAEQMEADITALIDALRIYGDIALASRLWCCQQQRREKRHAQRAGLTTGWARLCRSPACASCRRWLGRSWRERAATKFADADNGSCSLATIVLARTGDLHAVRELVATTRIMLRNLRDRRARELRRWCDVSLYGLVELDAIHVDDLRYLPPLRRAVVEALPSYSHAADVTWVPHTHISVCHPRLHHSELREALAQQWPGPVERVDVRPFNDEGDARTNAAEITAYSAKSTMRTTYTGGVQMAWPLSWQAAYWSWLCAMRRGLEPLRIRIAARGERQGAAAIVPAILEPMAIVF